MTGISNVEVEDLGSTRTRWHSQGGQIGALLKWGDEIDASRG